jgi:hypothetical protein
MLKQVAVSYFDLPNEATDVDDTLPGKCKRHFQGQSESPRPNTGDIGGVQSPQAGSEATVPRAASSGQTFAPVSQGSQALPPSQLPVVPRALCNKVSNLSAYAYLPSRSEQHGYGSTVCQSPSPSPTPTSAAGLHTLVTGHVETIPYGQSSQDNCLLGPIRAMENTLSVPPEDSAFERTGDSAQTVASCERNSPPAISKQLWARLAIDLSNTHGIVVPPHAQVLDQVVARRHKPVVNTMPSAHYNPEEEWLMDICKCRMLLQLRPSTYICSFATRLQHPDTS